MTILDLGTGTGNLAKKFIEQGCEVWGTDFSNQMLSVARKKLPAAHFVLHDLRQPFPPTILRCYDRIVSAYLFHHFELMEKLKLILQLTTDYLNSGGRLVIADISFPSHKALNLARQATGDDWDEEFYWIEADTRRELETVGINFTYNQITNCVGTYLFTPKS